MYRLISAEAVRFPTLADVYRETMRAFRAIHAHYLTVQNARGVLTIDDVEATMRLFGFLTIGEVRERTLLSQPPSPEEIDVMVRRGVRLFLQGYKAR